MGAVVMSMTYVLIPGAGGAAWYWHRVEAELAKRGEVAVAVDLPADDDTVGLDGYADRVVDAIGDRTDIVLVAQSMGGFTAALVCERVPVSLLVFLNAMIPAPGETAGEWWDNTGQGTAMRENDLRDGRAVDDASGEEDAAEFDVHAYFLHDLPAEVVDGAWEHAREQSDTPFGTSVTTSVWRDVPTKVIVGRDDRFFPADFQRRVAEERLGITPDVIPGGHLLALSQPEALVEQLETYRGAQPKAGE